jgi:cytochrome c oxidase assembly factor CtaG
VLVLAHASLGLSAVGLVVEIALGGAYIAAATRPSPRGNRWPLARTVSFLAGLVLLAEATQGPLVAHDDLLWVHGAQHLVLMMVVPPLLVLGAPITLLLRTLSPRARREVVAVLHDPAMKAVSGTTAGVALTIEYQATMFLVLLTPLYRLSLEHESVHVAVHAYLLTCGLLFWMPLVGRDPAGWRPSPRAKVWMVASGIPAYAVLGVLLVGRDTPLGGLGTLADTHAGGWVLGVGGLVLTAAGLALVAAQRAGTRSGSRDRWNARRMFAIKRAIRTQQAIDPEP